MDDDKKILEKRSSFRGWKERNKGKSRDKMPVIGVVAIVVIFSAVILYQYAGKNDTIPEPIAVDNPPGAENNSSSPGVVTPAATPEVPPKITPVATPAITENIIGKMNTPLVVNGFEITVTKVGSSSLFTNVWVIAKNIDTAEKPFKIGPSTVIIDDMGQQYENIHIQRSSELIQTNLMGKAMREGSIFFSPLKEGRSPTKVIININGQKAEIALEK